MKLSLKAALDLSGSSCVFTADMTVMSLLHAIAGNKRNDILIVCHDTSTKLMLKLSATTDIELTAFHAELRQLGGGGTDGVDHAWRQR